MNVMPVTPPKVLTSAKFYGVRKILILNVRLHHSLYLFNYASSTEEVI